MLLTSCPATPPRRACHRTMRRAALGLLVALGSCVASLPARPQTAASSSDVAPSERAKRDADKVFHWIMIQGDRARKPAAGAKDVKDSKDSREAKDERPAAKPVRAAAPELTPARAKADTSVAAIEPKPAGKLAEKPAQAAPAAGTAPVEDLPAPAPAPASPARGDPAPRDAAPVAEPVDDAPHGLVALAQPAPQFPASVMRALRRGTVQVRFDVLTDGSVSKLEVLKTTNARLNAAALEAIGQWRFQPVPKVQSGAVEVGFDLD